MRESCDLEELRDSTELITQPEILRMRLDDDGYLFFRGLLPEELLGRLSESIAAILAEHGWIVEGTDPTALRVKRSARCFEMDAGYMAPYAELQRLRAFHALPHDTALSGLCAAILGEAVVAHPNKVARLSFPEDASVSLTTPAHQDFVHFQGAFRNLTTWIPLTDCSVELGGLAVLVRDDAGRLLPHRMALGAGFLGIPEEHLEGTWHTTDYRTGDVLVFTGLTIHRALPNRTADQLRLSLDNRYQRISDPISERALLPHLVDEWSDIYADWPASELQYYWEDLGLDVKPHVDSFRDAGVDDALERAQRGDHEAVYRLEHLVRNDPQSRFAGRAREVLAKQR